MLPMHEWLSGGVSPCQGEGRGFESRLVLSKKEIEKRVIRWMALFSMFEPCRARMVRSLGSALIVDGLTFRSLKDRKSRLVNLANFLIWGKDLFEENKQMFYMDSV